MDSGVDDGPDAAHRAPEGASEAVVEALGKLSEALETTERARGQLYAFHQLTGGADLALGEAVELLREAGEGELADRIETQLVGRNVMAGRWTFQLVEEYDDGYWSLFRRLEAEARDRLAGGRRHLFEAGMKERRRSHGLPGHEAVPAAAGGLVSGVPVINNVVRYVADQDRSIAFWTGPMGYELRTDAEMSPGSRWVEVYPPGRETGIALLAAADFQVEPHGGDAAFTLVVADIREFHARMTAAGVSVSEPAEESYGTYVTMTCPDGYHHVVSQLRAG